MIALTFIGVLIAAVQCWHAVPPDVDGAEFRAETEYHVKINNFEWRSELEKRLAEEGIVTLRTDGDADIRPDLHRKIAIGENIPHALAIRVVLLATEVDPSLNVLQLEPEPRRANTIVVGARWSVWTAAFDAGNRAREVSPADLERLENVRTVAELHEFLRGLEVAESTDRDRAQRYQEAWARGDR